MVIGKSERVEEEWKEFRERRCEVGKFPSSDSECHVHDC